MKKVLTWLFIMIFIFQPFGTHVMVANGLNPGNVDVSLKQTENEQYGEEDQLANRDDEFEVDVSYTILDNTQLSFQFPVELNVEDLQEVLYDHDKNEVGTYVISENQLVLTLAEGQTESSGRISIPVTWNTERITEDIDSINLLFTHTFGSKELLVHFDKPLLEEAVEESVEEAPDEDSSDQEKVVIDDEQLAEQEEVETDSINEAKSEEEEQLPVNEEEEETEETVESDLIDEDLSKVEEELADEPADEVEKSEEKQELQAASTIIDSNILTSYEIRYENSNEETIDKPGLNSDIQINYTWELPDRHGYTEGATFQFDIPEQFIVYDEIDRVEMRFNNQIIGYFSVTKDGQATIEFTAFVEQFSNINGTVGLWTKFSEDLVLEEGKTITVTPIEGKESLTIPIDFNPSGSTMEKRGVPNRTYNSESVEWTVDFNKSMDTLTKAVLSDPVQEGQSLVDGSIKLYYLDMKLNGSSSLGDEVPTDEYELSNDPEPEFSILFKNDMTRAYRLVFTTELTDNTKSSFENKADLLENGSEVASAKSTVEVGRGTPLAKEVESTNGPSQTITWEVRYNYNERAIPQADATLKDSLTDLHQFQAGSLVVERITINENGIETASETVDYVDVITVDNGFELNFTKDINSAYKVTYVTKAKDRVFEGSTITNTVESGEGLEGSASQVMGQQILFKSNSNVNYQDKTVDWTIRFNSDKFEMNDVYLKDVFQNSGLRLVEDSIKITSNNEEMNEDNYTIKINEPNDFTNKNQFDIEFESIDDEVIITYTTEFDYEKREDKGKLFFENQAVFSWENPANSSDRISHPVNNQFTPDTYTRANGFKGGSYNAVDKEITWNIGVNYNLQPINQLMIKDDIEGNQQLVEDTIEVYEMLPSGSPDRVNLGDLVSKEDYELSINEDKNQFEIKFNSPVDQPYYITYKTSLNELSFIQKDYGNKATFSDGGQEPVELNASVSPPNGGHYTKKSGKQDGRFVNWNVNINFAQAEVDNVRLVDELTTNQLLLQDSFVVYDTSVEENGNVEKENPLIIDEDYTIEMTDNGFVLEFVDKVDRPYILEYKSFIQAGVGAEIQNNISFSGDQTDTETWLSASEITVARTQGIGDGSGELGSLTVEKIDAETNDEKLEGATFSLIDKFSDIVISTKNTDENGEVTFEGLLFGEYELREDKAPDDYVIGPNGTQTIDINGQNTLQVSNKKIKRHVELTKVNDETNEQLGGATFLLEKKNDDEWEAVGSDYQTDEDGILLIEDLDEGEYRLIETKAPDSYLLNAEPVRFEIKNDQTEITKVTKENTEMKKSLSFEKTSDLNSVKAVGDTVTYTFDVENTGNVTVTDLNVNDPMLGGEITLKTTELAPGEKTTGTASYTVTQEDLNKEDIKNFATVTGESPIGSLETEDDDTIPTEQSPEIGLIKAANRDELKVGEEIVYTFTAQNVGNVTLVDVSLRDELENISDITYLTINGEAIDDGESITLEPGSVLVAAATYTITQADVDRGEVENKATVTGETKLGDQVTDIDEVTVYEEAAGSLAFTKSSEQKTINQVGDKVTYTFEVENTGNVTATNIQVEDPMLGGEIELEKTELAPGEKTTGTATYVVTQADLNNGVLTNVAVVMGDFPDGTEVKETDEETTSVEQRPSLKLTKEANRDDLIVGEDIVYTFTVVNTGNVTLTNVVLTDELENLSEITLKTIDGEEITDEKSITLEPGSQLVAEATYTITQANVDRGEVTNQAMVEGNSPSQEKVSDEDEVNVEQELAPNLSLTKSSDLTLVKEVGETVTYTFEVENTGNVTITDLELTDPMLGGEITLETTKLAPGEKTTGTANYVITQEDLNKKDLKNTAIVTGESPDGSVVDSEDEDTIPTEQSPAIGLIKSANRDELKVGEEVVYTFTAQNVGNVTLVDVTLMDELENISDIKYLTINGQAIDDDESITLEPNSVLIAEATYTITQADIDRGEIYNNATVTGETKLGDQVTDSDEVTVREEAAGSLALTKSSEQKTISQVGDEVTYTFEVENTGNVTVTNIQVDDPMLGGEIELEKTELAPGEKTTGTAVYVVTQADLNNGVLTNVAAVTGEFPDGTEAKETDEETTSVEQQPSLELTKEANRDDLIVGEDIVYAFTVENTGNVTLTNVVLTDELENLSEITLKTIDGEEIKDEDSITLEPGSQLAAEATYTITQADVDRGEVTNEAMVEGNSPSQEKVSDEDQVVVEQELAPKLSLTKTSDLETVREVGETVTYTFDVENTGNVTITDLELTDPMLGGEITLETTKLAPGEKTTGTANYVITQEDLNKKDLKNTAIVTGTSPDESVIETEDDDTIPTEQSPAIALMKEADRDELKVGEEIVYTFTAQNVGNVTLVDVTLTDKLENISDITYLTINGEAIEDGELITLEPNSVLIAEATYTITQADIDRGEVYNDATVTGETKLGERVTDQDETTVYEEAVGSLAFTKSSDQKTISQVGDEVTYTFEVENTGNVTVTQIQVEDPMLGGEIELETAELAPGEKTTGMAVYVVTQANLNNGVLTNVAAVTGEFPDGTGVKETDDETTLVEQQPSLELTKEANRDDLMVGEDIVYTFTVVNKGNVTLNNVVLTDELENLSEITLKTIDGEEIKDEESVTLEPGSQLLAEATYTITQEDVDRGKVFNKAMVEGNAPSQEKVSDEDEVLIEQELAPKLSLTKTSDLETVREVGETVTYTFDVENTGNVTITDLELTDPMLGGEVTLETTKLAPGQTTTGTGSYTVTQEDLNKTDVKNIATVTGKGPDESVLETEDDDTIPTEQSPAIALMKEANRDELKVGEEIVYTFTAQNVGNVTLVDVTLTDELENISDITYLTINGEVIEEDHSITLEPGSVLVAEAVYTITQADIDRGEIYNEATVAGETKLGERVTEVDEVTVYEEAAGSLAFTKSSNQESISQVGDVVTYSFEVENRGNVTITNIQVEDPMLGGEVKLETTELAPGEKTTGTAVYAVTQSDLTKETLINVASVVGYTSDEKELKEIDDHLVSIKWVDQPNETDNDEPSDPTKNPDEAVKGTGDPKDHKPSQEAENNKDHDQDLSKDRDKENGNGTLVQTANNVFAMALTGIVLLAIGILFLQMNRKKKKNTV